MGALARFRSLPGAGGRSVDTGRDILVLTERGYLAVIGLIVSVLIIATFALSGQGTAWTLRSAWIPLVIALMLAPYLVQGLRRGLRARVIRISKPEDAVMVDGQTVCRVSGVERIELVPCNAGCEEFNLCLVDSAGKRHPIRADATRRRVVAVAQRLSEFLDLPVTYTS